MATGMGGTHFVTSLQCDYCHDTNFWTPLIFSHLSAGYPGDHRTNLICEDCHGGNTELVTWSAPQYQPDCAGCHATDFKPSAHKKFENPDSFYNERVERLHWRVPPVHRLKPDDDQGAETGSGTSGG
jgi:hypothetical protein